VKIENRQWSIFDDLAFLMAVFGRCPAFLPDLVFLRL